MRYSRKEFEEMVARSLAKLPEHVRKRMENVAICLEDRAKEDGSLLGLFEGVPQIEWGKGFGNELPDKITIFQESIERFAQTPEEVEEQVRLTVWHEVAHYFGFEDEELEKLERAFIVRHFRD